jgi:hypothetical protein
MAKDSWTKDGLATEKANGVEPRNEQDGLKVNKARIGAFGDV